MGDEININLDDNVHFKVRDQYFKDREESKNRIIEELKKEMKQE